MSSGEFRKAFKGIDNAIKQGTARALNRALSSTKTRVVRSLREDTGLKTSDITARTRSRKAAQNRLGVILAIAVKFGIALSKFSPLEKTVRVNRKGFSGKGIPYLGVSVKIGGKARQLYPGAFFLRGKTGEAVIGRKEAFDSKGQNYTGRGSKYPTVKLKTDIFQESAKKNEASMKQYLVDTFDKNVTHEIEYAISSKLSSNK